ncbi:MAG: hypothetical protein ABIH00_04590 [Armatimonadota bacterium]
MGIEAGAKTPSNMTVREVDKILSDCIKGLSNDSKFLSIYNKELFDKTIKVHSYKTCGGNLEFSVYLPNTYDYVSQKLEALLPENTSVTSKYLQELLKFQRADGPIVPESKKFITREGWNNIVSKLVVDIFENTDVTFNKDKSYLLKSTKVNFDGVKNKTETTAKKIVDFFARHDLEFSAIKAFRRSTGKTEPVKAPGTPKTGVKTRRTPTVRIKFKMPNIKAIKSSLKNWFRW